MRSKAHIKTHPLHPILVSFPIAFYIGTFIFEILGVLCANPAFAVTAGYLNIAGVAGAVAAAIPGFIDFIYTVPPVSSANKRAAKHGIINSVVLLIFGTIVYLRTSSSAGVYVLLSLEFAGVVLTTVAGWMGGTLVHRNQIGVDIRYAHAGKWNEQTLNEQPKPVEVCTTNELLINQMKLVRIGDKRIVIAKSESGFAAFDDRCSHKGGSLAGGAMICGTVQCPWHGSQFDVKTGAVKAGPAKERIHTYTVSEEGGKVYLHL